VTIVSSALFVKLIGTTTDWLLHSVVGLFSGSLALTSLSLFFYSSADVYKVWMRVPLFDIAGVYAVPSGMSAIARRDWEPML
jgi:hypothetical protein